MIKRKPLILILILIIFVFPQNAFCRELPDFSKFTKTLWYGLYMQDTKIGFMKYSFGKNGSEGWVLKTDMEMRAKMLGQEARMTVKDRKLYTNDGELSGLDMVFSSPTGDISMKGSVQGNEFVITTSIGGRQTRKVFTSPADTLYNEFLLESYIASGKCKVGDKYLIKSLDTSPPEPKIMTEEVSIADKKETVLNGIPTFVYTAELVHPEFSLKSALKFDSSGNLLEGSPGGFTIKLQTEEEAKDISNTFDILEGGLIVPKGQIPDFSSVKQLSFRISGMEKSDLISTESQRIVEKNGALEAVISRQTGPEHALSLPVNLDQVRTYLLPTALEQSDDPEIISLAKKIAGAEKNSWEAARKINDWVYKNIQKVFTPDISNALQTLHSGKGDCGEHTALAVALMRAAGIPARPVMGLVYWPAGKAMGYHAWTEVFVGKWVQMDPALGEDLADPSHIALAYDYNRMVGTLARAIGNIKIEILK